MKSKSTVSGEHHLNFDLESDTTVVRVVARLGRRGGGAVEVRSRAKDCTGAEGISLAAGGLSREGLDEFLRFADRTLGLRVGDAWAAALGRLEMRRASYGPTPLG